MAPTPPGQELRNTLDYVEVGGRRLPGAPSPPSAPSRRWRQRWSALAPGRRRLAATVVVAALGSGVSVAAVSARRAADAERAATAAVVLDPEVRVTTSAIPSPGGSVIFYLSVANHGPRDLDLVSLEARRGGLRLDGRLDRPRRVAAGDFTLVRLSVRLSCAAGVPASGALPADVEVRRADGSTASRTFELRQADVLVQRAEVVCRVRPEPGEQQLSGPVIVTS